MRLVREALTLAVAVCVAAGAAACDPRIPLDPSVPGSAGTGGVSGTLGPDAPKGGAAGTDDGAAIQAALMMRWNVVADAQRGAFDFHWGSFEQFPHPTYKGGSAPAYQAFAAVLLAFFRQADDFDFLCAHHLFSLRLVYIFPSGQVGLDTSFQALAADFASPGAFGDLPPEARQALQEYRDRIPSCASGAPVAPPPDAGVSSPDASAPDASAPDASYEAMCRNYCQALFETNLYNCVSGGGAADVCAAKAPPPELCYQLRCEPMLVTASLCLRQCDVASGLYDSVCGRDASAVSTAALCPSAPADHALACRRGCDPASGA